MPRGRARGVGTTVGSGRRSSSAPAAGEEPEDEEATESDMLELGMRVVASMSEEDMTTYLDRLSTECPITDKIIHTNRSKNLNWEAVSFAAYGAEECQAVWFYLRSGARKFRIMAEMVNEIKITLQSSTVDKALYQKKMIESAPGFPKKPAGMGSGFQLFCTSMWAMKPDHAEGKNYMLFVSECKKLWENVGKEQQTQMQHQADELRAEYVRQVKEFALKYPGLNTVTEYTDTGGIRVLKSSKLRKKRKPKPKKEKLKLDTPTTITKLRYMNVPAPPHTPQLLFIQTKLNKLEIPPNSEQLPELKEKYKGKWAKMKEKKRSRWIDKCIKMCQNYLIEAEEYKKKFPAYTPKEFALRNKVKKEELEIWEKYRGKPAKPPASTFDLFFENFIKDSEHASLPVEEAKELAREKWKNSSADERELCKLETRRKILEYKRDLERYYEDLPSLVKPLVLERMPVKFKKVFQTVDKVLETHVGGGGGGETDNEAGTEVENNDELLDLDEEEHDTSRKKHKKKKHREFDQDVNRDVEEIIDEGESQSQDEGTESEGGHKSKKKKRKRGHDEESESNTEANGNLEDDDFFKQPQPVMKSADERKSLILKELKRGEAQSLRKKPRLESSDQSNANVNTEISINKRHAYDVIRGIFDARQLGRTFSVYYYYAKYVAKEAFWMNKVEKIGLLATADQIYKTCISLPDHQKKLFIDQSYNFHHNRTTETKFQNANFNGQFWDKQGFPGEPKPPPRSAKRLYVDEIAILKSQNIRRVRYPKWENLDEERQFLYLKKLYRITNRYLHEYEDFVAKMTPSDLVMYTLERHKIWESRYLSHRATKLAAKGFIFPFPKRHLFGGEREPSPEILDNENDLKKRVLRRRGNMTDRPSSFANDDLIALVTENVGPEDAQRREEEVVVEDHDSDSPSDEELLRIDPKNRHDRAINEKIMRHNELRRLSMLNYPLPRD